MSDDARCEVRDGNERCCLIAGHPDTVPHMGRWYTMRQSDIKAFSEFVVSLSPDERRQLGAK